MIFLHNFFFFFKMGVLLVVFFFIKIVLVLSLFFFFHQCWKVVKNSYPNPILIYASYKASCFSVSIKAVYINVNNFSHASKCVFYIEYRESFFFFNLYSFIVFSCSFQMDILLQFTTRFPMDSRQVLSGVTLY